MLKLFSCAVPFWPVFTGPQRLYWYALDTTAVFCVASRYCIILCSGWAMRGWCKIKVVHKWCKCYFPITQNVALCSFEVGGLVAMRRRCMQWSPNLNQTSCRGASLCQVKSRWEEQRDRHIRSATHDKYDFQGQGPAGWETRQQLSWKWHNFYLSSSLNCILLPEKYATPWAWVSPVN